MDRDRQGSLLVYPLDLLRFSLLDEGGFLHPVDGLEGERSMVYMFAHETLQVRGRAKFSLS